MLFGYSPLQNVVDFYCFKIIGRYLQRTVNLSRRVGLGRLLLNCLQVKTTTDPKTSANMISVTYIKNGTKSEPVFFYLIFISKLNLELKNLIRISQKKSFH